LQESDKQPFGDAFGGLGVADDKLLITVLPAKTEHNINSSPGSQNWQRLRAFHPRTGRESTGPQEN